MSLQQKYVKVLSGILPAGFVGVSLLLGSTVPSVANEHPTTAQPLAANKDAVAQRLATIRDAVWPNWNNWRNWNNWNNWWRNW